MLNHKAFIRDNQALVLAVTPLALLAITGCLLASAPAPGGTQSVQPPKGQTEKGAEKETKDLERARVPVVKTVRAGGGRLDWCAKSDLMALDVRGKEK